MKRTTRINRIAMRPTPRPSRVPLLIILSGAFGLSTMFLVLTALLVAAGVGAYRYYQSVVPNGVQSLIAYEQQPYQVSEVEDRAGHVLQDVVDPNLGIRDIVPLSKIPINMQNATIDTENRTFYTDPGIDPVRLFKAGLHDVNGGGSGLQGGSTLTQQLVKQAVFGSQVYQTTRGLNQGTISRALQEAAIAIGATQHFKKDGILEMYLNTVPYGPIIYGVQAASKFYFGKDISQLDLAQCALLAGIPQATTEFDPLYHLPQAIQRQHLVLDGMLTMGHITRAQLLQAEAEPIASELVFKNPYSQNARTTIESYFVDWLVNVYLKDPKNLQQFHLSDLQQPDDVYRGFIFKTTLDPYLQSDAQNIVDQQVASLGNVNATDGALVAIDPQSNEIKAMVGGIGYNAPISGAQYNMAWQFRQDGSSVKPFTYVTAFEQGHFPAETINDAYVSYPDGATAYVPMNYDLSYHGLVTIRTALANSYNVPAVKTLYDLVPSDPGNVRHNIALVLKTENSMGYHLEIQDPKKQGLSFTLGADRGRLLEETNAYAVFANRGIYRPYMPILAIYRRVPGSSPQLVWQYHTPKGVQVLAPQFAYEITSILSDVPAKVPAFGDFAYSYLSLPDRSVAAKTGTTNDFKDNLTLGYTPNFVAGVWVGNPNNTAMLGSTGITGAAPIWHQFMVDATRRLPIEQFIQPPGIITATVAMRSPTYGLPGLAGSGATDIFAAGTVPKLPDNPSQDNYAGTPGQNPGAPGTTAPGVPGGAAPGTTVTAAGDPNQLGLSTCHGGRYTYTSTVVNGQTQYIITCQ
ncbi:MAG TPA: transglycosylase domain-containing protein [Chloroflexota bacterium]|nr:transglycosylase domain-containing protein [Chloroflexota bacterium]